MHFSSSSFSSLQPNVTLIGHLDCIARIVMNQAILVHLEVKVPHWLRWNLFYLIPVHLFLSFLVLEVRMIFASSLFLSWINFCWKKAGKLRVTQSTFWWKKHCNNFHCVTDWRSHFSCWPSDLKWKKNIRSVLLSPLTVSLNRKVW